MVTFDTDFPLETRKRRRMSLGISQLPVWTQCNLSDVITIQM